MPIKVDLGCGPPNRKRPGYVGVDLHAPNNPDIVADIRHSISELPAGCASHVLCSHAFEHFFIEEWRDILREMNRLLAIGGFFEVRVPHPSHDDAMIHGHFHVFTPRFWQDIKDGNNKIDVPLVIDDILEVVNPKAVECFKKQGAPSDVFDTWAPFLRNAYTETVVTGHKELAK